MKKIFLIIFIALFLAGTGLWLFLHVYEYRSMQEQSFNNYALTKEEYDSIREGDIILRHGYGFVSDMIVQQLKEEYDISHCAIVCRNDTGFFVVHSVSSSLTDIDGVQAQDLPAFIRESQLNSVIVVRYKSPEGKDNKAISKRAQDYLKKQIPFDEAFNINDSSEFYCTELLWKAILNEFGHDILLGKNNEKKDHLKFATFWDASLFEIVINHHTRKKKFLN